MVMIGKKEKLKRRAQYVIHLMKYQAIDPLVMLDKVTNHLAIYRKLVVKILVQTRTKYSTEPQPQQFK